MTLQSLSAAGARWRWCWSLALSFREEPQDVGSWKTLIEATAIQPLGLFVMGSIFGYLQTMNRLPSDGSEILCDQGCHCSHRSDVCDTNSRDSETAMNEVIDTDGASNKNSQSHWYWLQGMDETHWPGEGCLAPNQQKTWRSVRQREWWLTYPLTVWLTGKILNQNSAYVQF